MPVRRKASERRFFLPGHDRRAFEQVFRAKYGNLPAFLLAHGFGPRLSGAKAKKSTPKKMAAKRKKEPRAQ